MKKWNVLLPLVILLILSLSAVMPQVNVHATPVKRGFDVWTDKHEYHSGESVTAYVQIPPVLLYTDYLLVIYKPDGTQVTLDLGHLDPGNTYSFSIGQASPPPGGRRVQFRNDVELYAYTSFDVIGGQAPQVIQTSLTLNALPSQVAMDMVTRSVPGVTLSGVLTPPTPGAPIEITITGPSGLLGRESVIANGDTGGFSMFFTPSQLGNYMVTASYPGDENHRPSQASATVTVVPVNVISVTTTVSTIFTLSLIDYGLLSVGVGIAIAGLAISYAVVRRKRS